MNKQTYILMIFEGKKTEPQILKSLEKYFLNEKEETIIKAIFGTTIYSLYQKFISFDEFDDDLDTFTLAQIMNSELENISKEQIAEIYLFFDYDKHATNSDDECLKEMLKVFNNETEKGKLYISYPMVEAIKHFESKVDFKDTKAKCEKKYKKNVEEKCDEEFKHFNRYSKENWDYIVKEHSKKANYIVTDNFSFPNNLIEQNEIFEKQKEQYIKDKKVFVLGSFPIFLLDYYGTDRFRKNDKKDV